MAEELQALLQRIQKDGVDKAEADARKIIDSAKAEAAAIRKNAASEAELLLKRANSEAAAFEQRARDSLKQAARDVVLSVREAIGSSLDRLVAREVAGALDAASLGRVIETLVSGYFSKQKGDIEILLPESTQKELADRLFARFGEELRKGITISGEGAIRAGFRVREAGGKIEHDFTDDAIAGAISQLLRPRLAEIVRETQGNRGKAASKPEA